MPIEYDEKRKGWGLIDPSEEEKDSLIQVALNVIVLQIAKQFAEQNLTGEQIRNLVEQLGGPVEDEDSAPGEAEPQEPEMVDNTTTKTKQ